MSQHPEETELTFLVRANLRIDHPQLIMIGANLRIDHPQLIMICKQGIRPWWKCTYPESISVLSGDSYKMYMIEFIDNQCPAVSQRLVP